MRRWLLVAFLVSSILPARSEANPVAISNDVRVDVLGSVPVEELWSLAEPDIVEAAAVVVDIRAFDREASPVDGTWRGCAIVMIGTSDLAVTPVAVRVWTSGACQLKIRTKEVSVPREHVEFEMDTGSSQRISLGVNADLDVTMNGVVIGRVQQ